MTDEQQQAYDMQQSGMSRAAIADEMGISVHAVKRRLLAARKWIEADPAVAAAAKAGGLGSPAVLGNFWKIGKDENGNGYSLHIKNPDSGEEMSFSDMIRNAIEDGYADQPLTFEPRATDAKGEHLLVVDLADVHFGKLCVESETGYTYNRDVARHRVIEGTKALLRGASGFGVGRILFVLGNDILHTEDGKSTTSNTQQDSDGSYFQMFSDAKSAIQEAILECVKVADVDLVHVMSNHDWRSGWALSQVIAEGFKSHPNVNASEYNMSEIHRKYYGFENNAFLFTHGDGTKEEKLYGHFVQEARQLVSSCKNVYSMLHHVHHKIRKRRGVDVFQTEKDHNGMTAIMSGSYNVQGVHMNIEYVRSPSPPDGWHDRNGYVNRQGVECFLFHPRDGMKVRFTEWM